MDIFWNYTMLPWQLLPTVPKWHPDWKMLQIAMSYEHNLSPMILIAKEVIGILMKLESNFNCVLSKIK